VNEVVPTGWGAGGERAKGPDEGRKKRKFDEGGGAAFKQQRL